MFRRALGSLLGRVARLWIGTLRPVALGALPDSGPRVLALCHGQQLCLLAARHALALRDARSNHETDEPRLALLPRQADLLHQAHESPRARATHAARRLGVLVSRSADGDLQAAALPALGLVVRRGSSSRGGAAGLAAMIRLLRQHLDVAFAVDGPRGPYGTVHPGAIVAAQRTGAPLVPIAAYPAHAIVLSRAWDRFEIPLPFTRVVLVVGDPIALDRPLDDVRTDLAHSLATLREIAHRACPVAALSPVIGRDGRKRFGA